MILPDWKIRIWQSAGELVVDPFDEARINPASIDLCIGGEVWDLTYGFQSKGDVVRLLPGQVILVTTVERVRIPSEIAGQLVLKSSLGRRGVSMPAAGWIDPGFEGTLTVQLSACVPVELKVGTPFVQLVLHRMWGKPDEVYEGKYLGQEGVTLAR